MSSTASKDLEKERLGLLLKLGLPEAGAGSPSCDALEAGDLETIGRILGSPLECWEQGKCPLSPAPVIELLQTAEDGRRRLLEADIELISEVMRTCEAAQLEGAFGLMSAAFPVSCQGKVVYVAWLRNYRTDPFSDSEIQDIAEAAGRSVEEVNAVAGAGAILNAIQEQQLLDLTRGKAEAIDHALREHLRAGEVVQQLLQSERTRALGTLSGGVAHHFNNLLSIILGYSSFILNREQVSDAASDALHKISDAAQRGRRLTEEILAFAGSDVEEESTCHVHRMLGSIVSLLQSQTSSHVTIHNDLGAEIDTVTAPPSSIHQLVFNLLSSAIDSMPGGGELRVESFNREETQKGRTANHLVLRITDSSLPEDAEAAPGSSQRISHVEGIAGSLGGAVEWSADAGEGTRVEVSLPITTGEPDAPAAAVEPARVIPSSIWVVDDDAIFRELCRQVLGDEGHTVSLMESGREMQEAWAAAAPDLIVVDFSMPECNGLELCTWLKERGSGVPVILVSGFSESQPDIHKILQYRRTYFLRKPFSFRELTDTVTVALGETLIGASLAQA